MSTKRYDYKRIFKDGDNEYLHARGILTVTIPGLAKTKTGKLVTPTLKIDEEGNIQNFFFKDGNPLPLYDFSGDGKEKIVSQPAMVGKTKEKKILLWVNENGEDSFFALEAWDVLAKRLNMFYKKGQKVTILAHKVISKGSVNSRNEVLWVLDDICKVEDDLVYSKKVVAETTETTEETNIVSEEVVGFVETDSSDLPFAD